MVNGPVPFASHPITLFCSVQINQNCAMPESSESGPKNVKYNRTLGQKMRPR